LTRDGGGARSRSLEKGGSRRSSEKTQITESSSCLDRDEQPMSKSQSMEEVGDEDAFKRAHRHSIPGHRLNNYLKFLNELAAKGSSTAHLFSTAVISGSSSAPNLKDEDMPQHPDGIGFSIGMPNIRPLETLHNALSLRQLDSFLSFVTSANFKTPISTPTASGSKPGSSRGGGISIPDTPDSGMFNFKNYFSNHDSDVNSHRWLLQSMPKSTQIEATPVILYQRIQQIQQEQKQVNKGNQWKE